MVGCNWNPYLNQQLLWRLVSSPNAHGSGLLSQGLAPAWEVVGIALVDGSEMAPATPLAYTNAAMLAAPVRTVVKP